MKSNIKTMSKQISNTEKVIPQSNVKSLRSIINETKVPLSEYINNQRSSIQKRPNKVDRVRTKTSYFQKFKGMIGNGVVERREQYSFDIPHKILSQVQNMEEETIFHEHKTVDYGERPSMYKKKIIERLDRSRSKSTNHNYQLPLQNLHPENRKSFQPGKNLRIQQNTIFHPQLQRLPPKPLKIVDQPKKLQIRKNQQTKTENVPNSSRSTVRRATQIVPEVKRQHSEMKPQSTLDEMIDHIHSHRRLNFSKQQERRKQTIVYGKTFQKIAQNRHSNQVKVIESTPIQIGEILGNGAFSYVKVGHPKGVGINKKLAIKIYEKYKLIEPGRKTRVMKEIQILSRLNHPNVIKLFCAYENKRQIHILFEQIEESITLQEYFKHMSLRFDDLQLLSFIMKQVLKGLDYLHSLGISHRDIKPDNILLSFKDTFPTVKLIDFGFATTCSVSSLNCGTPNFMAPQLFKKQPYSPMKADLWALAVTFYYLFQSKYPFKGFNQKDLTRNICQANPKFQKTPNQFQEILSLLFQANPNMRISAKETLDFMGGI